MHTYRMNPVHRCIHTNEPGVYYFPQNDKAALLQRLDAAHARLDVADEAHARTRSAKERAEARACGWG